MPARPDGNSELHGNVADHSPTALLLIDVINAFDFPGAEKLLEQALPMADEINRLRRAAGAKGIPVIYANDNFGRWRSSFGTLIDYCSSKRGGAIVKKLAPRKNDYFVLKPKNSAFYTTTLDLLLQHIGVRRLIVVGWLGNNCVLFSANDAYMRDYKLIIPADCTASIDPRDNAVALQQMKKVLKANISPWRTIKQLK
jgi:nicotinamidase-related amidase